MQRSFLVPRLQEGVVLPRGTASRDGKFVVRSQTGRFFEVSPTALDMLRLVDGRRDIAEIKRCLDERAGGPSGLDEPEISAWMASALGSRDLINVESSAARAPRAPRKRSPVWIKAPLLPTPAVGRLASRLAALCERRAVLGAVASAALMHGMALAHVSSEIPVTLRAGESWPLLVLLVLLGGFLHELGHAASLVRHGEWPGTLGVGMYYWMPVFYVDLTAASALPRRRRALVDLGGVYFQFLFSGCLCLAWLWTRSDHLLTAAAWLDVGIVWNLNPLLDLDGYWFLSDVLDVRNLRSKATRALTDPAFARDQPRARRSLLLFGSTSQLALCGLAISSMFFLGHRIVEAVRQTQAVTVAGGAAIVLSCLVALAMAVGACIALYRLGASVLLLTQRLARERIHSRNGATQ